MCTHKIGLAIPLVNTYCKHMDKDKGNFHMRRVEGDTELFARVNAWRETLDDKPSKSEAVRRLIRLGLKVTDAMQGRQA